MSSEVTRHFDFPSMLENGSRLERAKYLLRLGGMSEESIKAKVNGYVEFAEFEIELAMKQHVTALAEAEKLKCGACGGGGSVVFEARGEKHRVIQCPDCLGTGKPAETASWLAAFGEGK